MKLTLGIITSLENKTFHVLFQNNQNNLYSSLADGNNDLNEKKSKTVQQAEEELAAAVTDAKTKGYPIYTIGLNANGKLNKDMLTNIAASTNGKFFETNTADALPAILSEIFAAHTKLKISPINEVNGNGDFQEVKFSVPNANVLEAFLDGKQIADKELSIIR